MCLLLRNGSEKSERRGEEEEKYERREGKLPVIKAYRMRQGTVQQQGGKGIRDWTRLQHVLVLCGNAWLVKVFVHRPLNLRCCPHETVQETPVSAAVQEPPGTRRPPLAQLRGGAGLSTWISPRQRTRQQLGW